jgi:mannose-1-phosphate guanylyltransferase
MDNKNNYCVIMSGGIGSRFWPFSREARPKQFLDFFGTGRSLLQMTVDRLKKIVPLENIYIVTNESYAEITKQEVPEISDKQILLEPLRRNTAPCIAYASYHINAINPDANILVAPSDHLILKENEFISVIKRAFEFVEQHPILLTLGISPNRPETGYGYIQIDEEKIEEINKVKVFTEKPNYELAKIFYESGEFLWNSGMFIWNVKTILQSLQENLPEVATILKQNNIYGTDKEHDFIKENYAYCPNISIDYGLMEKASNVYVATADFGWSDLGTWGSLHELSDKDKDANAALKCDTLFVDSSENIVSLPSGKLAVIQGLDNYIVAETDDILLICKKEEEQRIKQFVADIKLKYGDKYI